MRVEKKETDFRVVYKGVNPFHYSVVVCPFCFYTASHKTFANKISLETAEQLSLALQHLKKNGDFQFCGERDIKTVLYSFQLAVACSRLKKAPWGETAGFLLGTAWIFREMENKDLEMSYLEKARDAYVEAYSSVSTGNLGELQVMYLIGELNRRLRNFKEAVNWFARVLNHKGIKRNPNIEKITREQWAQAREEIKKKQPA